MPDEKQVAVAEAPLPTPATNATEKGSAQAPGQGSAPDKAPETTVAKQEGSEKVAPAKAGDEVAADKTPVGKIAFEFRQKKRDLEAKATQATAEKDAEIARLKAQLDAKVEAPKGKADLLENPDLWKQEFEAEMLAKVERATHRKEAEAKIVTDSQAAEKWFLTRKHLDPMLAADVQKFSGEGGEFYELGATHPKAAVTMAYIKACEIRGIQPDLDIKEGVSEAQIARGNGVKPTAPPAGNGPKNWTRNEARAYLDAAPMGSDERRSRSAEVKKAENEGRVR